MTAALPLFQFFDVPPAALGRGKRPRRREDGLRKPLRPMPADFRETYLAMGWDGITDHYRTNWRVIRRWIMEAGGDALRAERQAVTHRPVNPARRSSLPTDLALHYPGDQSPSWSKQKCRLADIASAEQNPLIP